MTDFPAEPIYYYIPYLQRPYLSAILFSSGPYKVGYIYGCVIEEYAALIQSEVNPSIRIDVKKKRLRFESS